MKILVTGSNGFIGKNLRIFLAEQGFTDVTCFEQDHSYTDLVDMVAKTEFVFHLAGVNRPKDEIEFSQGNTDLTQRLVSLLSATGRNIPLVLTSSIQADRDNAYGKSKAAAEQVALDYMRQTGSPAYVYRLANVFGKWCRPNYNSAVATFCHNTVHDLPITIHDANAPLALVYIDDVCVSFIDLLSGKQPSDYQQGGYKEVEPVYHTTVGAVAEALQKFKQSRINLITEEVGAGLMRALYATYLSYFSPSNFAYAVPGYTDPRGSFVEMLKTSSAGQFSFFTAHPGVTRGGHYHHTKNEKFLVIKGTANYRFKQIITGEEYSITVNSGEYKIIETVPGWTHDITNIGEEELVVMLWANEIFDRSKPDTIASQLA